MAKIGNECRLVLKLAAERAERKREGLYPSSEDSSSSKDFKRGFVAGLTHYALILNTVTTELER